MKEASIGGTLWFGGWLFTIGFANLVWSSCQPPNAEAAVTNHWPPPAGCEQGN